MRETIGRITMAAATLFLLGTGERELAYATPSTTYWTPATADVQPYGVWHLGIDNYFTLTTKGGRIASLPTDAGLTVGVLPYKNVQLEVGVDIFEPTTDPLYFNAKLGTPEGALFPGCPAVNIGIFNVGTDAKVTDGDGRTDYRILHVMAGKTVPMGWGRIHAGWYAGNKKALVGNNGQKANTGFMIGYDRGFLPAKDDQGNYNRWVLAADYASGKNAIGGGGLGVYYYYTRAISLLTGPVWFNEPAMAIGNADVRWVWTTQLDVNF